MTKLLEQAITKVRELPDEDQEAVAAVMLSMAGVESPPVVRLDDATRWAVREGVAQAERGEFVPDDVIARADKLHGL